MRNRSVAGPSRNSWHFSQLSCDTAPVNEESSAARVSVLLSFSGENVRSFRDPFEFSLLATPMAEPAVVRDVRWREGGKPLAVLPAAAIFGSNASGKSNVLRAMDDMRRLVLTSFRSASPTGSVDRIPFRLDPDAADAPSTYEIDMVLDDVRHTYRFVVDDARVLSESAHAFPHGRARLLFERDGDAVQLGSAAGPKGRGAAELLRPNALFLSTAAAVNHPTLLPLYAWFTRNLILAEASSRDRRQAFTTQLLDDPDAQRRVIELLRAADLGITGAVKRPIDPVLRERLQRVVSILMGTDGEADGGSEGPTFEELGVRLVHQGASGPIELEPEEESLGTRVWFGLVGPVLAALDHGSVFLADELDASLHPALVSQLVRLFNDPATNPRRAQLVFNTHDATLLGDSASERLLGRDQVWFTEKLADGATRLYPLSDLSPRKEEAVARRYLAGRYGAAPILADADFDAAVRAVAASAT